LTRLTGRSHPARGVGCVLVAVMGVGTALAAPKLSGTISVGPTCPGPQLDSAHCSQPLPAVRLRLLNTKEEPVAEAVSDGKGRFEFAAPPGHYSVDVLVAGKLPRCPRTTVTIPSQTALLIDCDSGRR
jgi:hypothetical protein